MNFINKATKMKIFVIAATFLFTVTESLYSQGGFADQVNQHLQKMREQEKDLLEMKVTFATNRKIKESFVLTTLIDVIGKRRLNTNIIHNMLVIQEQYAKSINPQEKKALQEYIYETIREDLENIDIGLKLINDKLPITSDDSVQAAGTKAKDQFGELKVLLKKYSKTVGVVAELASSQIKPMRLSTKRRHDCDLIIA